MSNSILIMDGEAMMRALRRIAHEILEHNPDPDGFSLVGIPSRGVELARRMADLIEAIEGRRPELGAIDVSMHRDDLRIRNTLTSVRETRLPLQKPGTDNSGKAWTPGATGAHAGWVAAKLRWAW